MIGKVCILTAPYYNVTTGRNDFKSRPALIIGEADRGDYNILPVSKVSNRANLDADCDVPVDPSVYTKLSLTAMSYVRTHKQTTFHRASLHSVIGDMRMDYPELYLDVMAKLDGYNKKLIEEAF